MAKKLNKCKSGKDFIRFCSNQEGAEIKQGKGSHTKVKNKNGMAVIPNHNKDLGIGIRSKILKQLSLMFGIIMIALVVFVGLYV